MKTIRYLNLIFENELRPPEIPFFRAAVIEHTEREESLFHNHTPGGGYLYRHPLIQYKIIKGRAALLCLHEGVEVIHELFRREPMAFRIGKRSEQFKVEEIYHKKFDISFSEHRIEHEINHWIALNQANFAKYSQLRSMADKVKFLERILIGNILGFAESIDWHVPERIRVEITSPLRQKTVTYKGQPILAFSCIFDTNILLPPWLGLGKGSSIGFGTLKPRKHAGFLA